MFLFHRTPPAPVGGSLIALQNAVRDAEQRYDDAPKLIAIDRSGRINTFTFERRGETFTVETMGLISDDIVGWRNTLLND